MTEYVALFHRGHDAVEQVQIRTADSAGGDLDDRVAPVLDPGIRHCVASNVVLAVPGERFHPNSPCRKLCRDKVWKAQRFLDITERRPNAGVSRERSIGDLAWLPDLWRSSPVGQP